jgi:hypothetical protein
LQPLHVLNVSRCYCWRQFCCLNCSKVWILG